jgi:hypothetical protein
VFLIAQDQDAADAARDYGYTQEELDAMAELEWDHLDKDSSDPLDDAGTHTHPPHMMTQVLIPLYDPGSPSSHASAHKHKQWHGHGHGNVEDVRWHFACVMPVSERRYSLRRLLVLALLACAHNHMLPSGVLKKKEKDKSRYPQEHSRVAKREEIKVRDLLSLSQESVRGVMVACVFNA